MKIVRHASHESFASDLGLNRNVAKSVRADMAIMCPNSMEIVGVRVIRYLGSSEGKWVVEVHDTWSGGMVIHKMWAKRFVSARASLNLFSDIAAELVRYYLGSLSPADTAAFVVETFNLEPV